MTKTNESSNEENAIDVILRLEKQYQTGKNKTLYFEQIKQMLPLRAVWLRSKLLSYDADGLHMYRVFVKAKSEKETVLELMCHSVSVKQIGDKKRYTYYVSKISEMNSFRNIPSNLNPFRERCSLNTLLKDDFSEFDYSGSEKSVEVFLKLNDAFFEGNNEKLKQLKVKIPSDAVDCMFQRLSDYEKESVHKILIPIGSNERMLEIKCRLNNSSVGMKNRYSYFVMRMDEKDFNPPQKDFVRKTCVFSLLRKNDKKGSDSEDFVALYNEIDSLEISLTEINRERDQKIWSKYIEGQKLIIEAKALDWKIKDFKYIEPSSMRQNDFNSVEERSGIGIFTIDESGMEADFAAQIKEIATTAAKEMLLLSQSVDVKINTEEGTAAIEFGKIIELDERQIYELNRCANKYFYEYSNEPQFGVCVQINYKNEPNADKSKLFAQIKNTVKYEYGIDFCSIDGASFKIKENDVKYVKKIMDDKFASCANLEWLVPTLKVSFDFVGDDIFVDANSEDIVRDELKRKLNKIFEEELNYNNSDIYFSGNLLIAEIRAALKRETLEKIEKIGLRRIKTTDRYKNKFIPAEKNENIKDANIYIEDGFYCADNVFTKEKSKEILELLQQATGDIWIRQQATKYVFARTNEIEPAKEKANHILEQKREFKRLTDREGKNKFDINTSLLEIEAENKAEYEAILEEIKKNVRENESISNARIEEVTNDGKNEDRKNGDLQYEKYKIVFMSDFELLKRRKSITEKIINDLRERNILKISCGEGDFSKIIFTSNSASDCEKFKSELRLLCKKYKTEAQFDAENAVDLTLIKFKKSEELEKESEENVKKNLKNQEFKFWTVNEDNQLVERDSVGILLSKNGNKVRFSLSQQFENAYFKGAFPFDRNGNINCHIKPYFAGELSNIARMENAMKKLAKPGKENGVPANANLPAFVFNSREARKTDGDDIEQTKNKILEDLNEPRLKNQPNQIEAVAKSLLAKDLAVIQGPPGTGKTTVIAEIIWQMLLRNRDAKILVSSQTNLAVDNILDRLEAKKIVRPLRIGKDEKLEDFGKPYSLERISDWVKAKPGSEEEKQNSDNAAVKWIEEITENCSSDSKYEKTIAKWKQYLKCLDENDKKKFADSYVNNSNVFAATCSLCGTDVLKNRVFEAVIVDETSKATPPELAIPLVLGKKIILIGDHKQLPPMIDEDEFSEALEKAGAKGLANEWTQEDYKTSQFERIFKSADESIKASLDTQFRMHGQIMNCVSQFYKDQKELTNGLVCGIKNEMDVPDFYLKASRWHGLKNNPFIETDTHAIWVNVEGYEEAVGTSWKNEDEINAIKTVIKTLAESEGFEEYQKHFSEDGENEIGVITFYLPQMLAIRDTLYPKLKKSDWIGFERHKLENEFSIPFRINTVDRFQGMERNIIIVSAVRSDKRKLPGGKTINNKELGFAKAPERINVAFSRAKRLLIVIGNQKHFEQREEYRNAIKYMRKIDFSQIEDMQNNKQERTANERQ